ncbi:Alpha/Beta hydrolase protein [Mycena albidolilacea]|uniref:Alpha/Beta hydrolase protein n=1 Tax=Mycena albidolilacea TaxID=1033008 RepID=A0AAD6ZMQ8_9AGAR|nr:Alpha/Beta hydrolase protein [Mycena albidolilacea]
MESAIIAHPHCEDCFTGVKHSGDPVGHTVEIANIPTYVSEPPLSIVATHGGPKKVVLFFSDVYGPFYVNNQLLQDYFASQGFSVVGLDYFLGDRLYEHTEEGFDRWAWGHAARAKALEITPRWVEEVRKQYGSDSKYCAVGYCFGAPFVMDLGATDDIVAGAFAHPGFLTEDHFKNLKRPLLMSCAESDFTFPTEFRRLAEDILVEKKAQYQIQVFSGVKHGFAVRGDLENSDGRWAKEESARGIIGWFARFSSC